MYFQEPSDYTWHWPSVLRTRMQGKGCQPLPPSHRFTDTVKLWNVPPYFSNISWWEVLYSIAAAGVILDSVGSLHGATELTGGHDVTTPIIDQITAQQIAGSAMFGTVENMQRGGQERRPAKSSLSQVKYM